MPIGTLHLLRLVHVVLGVFWVGAVTFIAFLLIPSLRAAGPAGGAVMEQLAARRMHLWLMGAGILTVLSGFGLYWHDSAGFSSSTWLASGPARTFGFGAVMALIAVVLGMAVNSPAASRLGALGARIKAAGRPPSPDELAEIQRLQQRLARASVLQALLLLLAAAAMAVARYT